MFRMKKSCESRPIYIFSSSKLSWSICNVPLSARVSNGNQHVSLILFQPIASFSWLLIIIVCLCVHIGYLPRGQISHTSSRHWTRELNSGTGIAKRWQEIQQSHYSSRHLLSQVPFYQLLPDGSISRYLQHADNYSKILLKLENLQPSGSFKSRYPIAIPLLTVVGSVISVVRQLKDSVRTPMLTAIVRARETQVPILNWRK